MISYEICTQTLQIMRIAINLNFMIYKETFFYRRFYVEYDEAFSVNFYVKRKFVSPKKNK